MDKKGWRPCPKLTVDAPVYVPQARCLTCGGCAEAATTALGQLMVVPKDASEFLRIKERLKGRCPKTRGWCNASRCYCAYNMVCADEHARMEYRFCIQEVRMFLIRKTDGSMVIAKAKAVKDVEFGADVKSVYEVKKKLVLVKTLLPVSKESEDEAPLKAPALKNAKIILADSNAGNLRPMGSADEFLREMKSNPGEYCGLIIEKVYQPSYELKIVPLEKAAAPKKKKAPKNGDQPQS